MDQIRHNKTDKEATTGYQTARQNVRLIVQFPYAPEHTLACFFADIRVLPKHLGDRDYRKPKLIGDVFHSNRHGENYTALRPNLCRRPAMQPARYTCAKRKFTRRAEAEL